MPKKQKPDFSRSPTLETIQMVEHTIKKNTGKYNRTELWKKLPKGVMWQTYLVILEYLIKLKRIEIDSLKNIIFKIIKKEAVEEKALNPEQIQTFPNYVG